MASGRPLTEEERRRIIKAMNAGGWPTVIAREMGITRRTVVDVTKKENGKRK